jgi:hypothetical protein
LETFGGKGEEIMGVEMAFHTNREVGYLRLYALRYYYRLEYAYHEYYH